MSGLLPSRFRTALVKATAEEIRQADNLRVTVQVVKNERDQALSKNVALTREHEKLQEEHAVLTQRAIEVEDRVKSLSNSMANLLAVIMQRMCHLYPDNITLPSEDQKPLQRLEEVTNTL